MYKVRDKLNRREIDNIKIINVFLFWVNRWVGKFWRRSSLGR